MKKRSRVEVDGAMQVVRLVFLLLFVFLLGILVVQCRDSPEDKYMRDA